MTPWTYRGETFTDPGDSLGFIYEITCLTNGKRYIGRKMFTAAARRQVKGKKKKYRKESDWKTYWSSSDDVKADLALYAESKFTREILYLCDTKSTMTYLENYVIFTRHALIREDYYNQWITARVRKSNLLKTQLPNLFA
jgi:hypothetical protein